MRRHSCYHCGGRIEQQGYCEACTNATYKCDDCGTRLKPPHYGRRYCDACDIIRRKCTVCGEVTERNELWANYKQVDGKWIAAKGHGDCVWRWGNESDN